MAEENQPQEDQKEEITPAEEKVVSEAVPKEDAAALPSDGEEKEDPSTESKQQAAPSETEAAVDNQDAESAASEISLEPEVSAEENPDDASASSVSDEVVQVEETPTEEPAQESSDGPKKILDVLDKQAETDGTSADISSSTEEPVPADESSPDNPPLPPGAVEEEPSVEASSDEDSSEDVKKARSALDGSMEPELMISEAMKKLDKIIDEIKEGEPSEEGDSGQSVDDAGEGIGDSPKE